MHVMRAFVGTREARDAASLTQLIEDIATTRDQLMGIRLVPHIEHELVARRVDERVHGQDDFDSAERRRHMAARLRRGDDDLRANLVREDGKLLFSEQLQIGRRRYGVENAVHENQALLRIDS